MKQFGRKQDSQSTRMETRSFNSTGGPFSLVSLGQIVSLTYPFVFQYVKIWLTLI